MDWFMSRDGQYGGVNHRLGEAPRTIERSSICVHRAVPLLGGAEEANMLACAALNCFADM